MKLIKGNGRTLEVRDVGPVVYQLTAAGSFPIQEYGSRIVSDDEARDLIRKFKAQGHAGQAVKDQGEQS